MCYRTANKYLSRAYICVYDIEHCNKSVKNFFSLLRERLLLYSTVLGWIQNEVADIERVTL